MLERNWVYEITVQGQADGQAIINQFHLVTENPELGANGATLQMLLTAVQLKWRTQVCSRISNAYKAVFYRVAEISAWQKTVGDVPGHWIYLGQDEKVGDVDDDAGQVAGAWLPTYAAVNIRKRVLLTGKRFHGAMRLSPIVEADTIAAGGNTLTDAAFAAFSGAGSNMQAAWTVDPGGTPVPMRMCLFHKAYVKKKNLNSNDARVYADVLNSTLCNRQIGSQVSRKRSNRVF